MKLFDNKDIEKFNKVCGIYLIMAEHREYVGSSKNILKRWKDHKRSLENNKHHNSTFQNIFNKYGKSIFDCYLITSCKEEELEDFENYYINLINPFINHIRDVKKIVWDDRYKKNFKEAMIKRFINGFEAPNKKKVYQYNLNGSFIKEFSSVEDAHKYFNIKAGIHYAARNNGFSNGYIWSYNKHDIISIKEKKYVKSPVIQLDLNDKEIKNWKSITEAQNELKISNIVRAIKYNKTAGNFK